MSLAKTGANTKLCGVAICLVVGFALTFVTPALAAQDPVEKGSMKLKLSSGFADALESQGVKMSPTSFSVDTGSIDPIDGTGTLALKERLRFRTQTRKLVFRKVNARLGGDGALKVGGVRMFRLQGGKVERNGFGAQVKGVRARLTSKGARKLRRRLGLRGLRRMRAGRITVSEQPHTVEVTGGTVKLVPDPRVIPGSGTLASKLQSHCINFISGNTRIAPAVKVENDPDPTAPYYVFPVSGGTIGAAADAGSVELSGGLRLLNNNSSSPSSAHCGDMAPAPRPPLAQLDQTELAYKFGARAIASRVVVTQTGTAPVPNAGDQGVGFGADFSLSSATVSADPSAHTITVKNIVIRQTKGAALTLNQFFPQPVGHLDGAQEFNGGDLFGYANLTVTTR
jgi:hypothetical protein